MLSSQKPAPEKNYRSRSHLKTGRLRNLVYSYIFMQIMILNTLPTRKFLIVYSSPAHKILGQVTEQKCANGRVLQTVMSINNNIKKCYTVPGIFVDILNDYTASPSTFCTVKLCAHLETRHLQLVCFQCSKQDTVRQGETYLHPLLGIEFTEFI